jgi:hypothetical protein
MVDLTMLGGHLRILPMVEKLASRQLGWSGCEKSVQSAAKSRAESFRWKEISMGRGSMLLDVKHTIAVCLKQVPSLAVKASSVWPQHQRLALAEQPPSKGSRLQLHQGPKGDMKSCWDLHLNQ